MAQGTNGIATKADCNQIVPNAFPSTINLKKCPSCEVLESTNLFVINNSYPLKKLVKFQDISAKDNSIETTLKIEWSPAWYSVSYRGTSSSSFNGSTEQELSAFNFNVNVGCTITNIIEKNNDTMSGELKLSTYPYPNPIWREGYYHWTAYNSGKSYVHYVYISNDMANRMNNGESITTPPTTVSKEITW